MTTLIRVLAFLLLGATLFIIGCDVTSSDPVYDNGVRSQEFTPRGGEFYINTTGDIATFETTSSLLTPAIVDRGVVLLYARGDLVMIGGAGTWMPLPYTQGIEPPSGEPYVDITITYTYAFEVNRLYLDVVSSAFDMVYDYVPNSNPNGSSGPYCNQNPNQAPNQYCIPFRLVTIPPGTAGMDSVDFTNYAEVAAAYGLDQ